MKKIDPKTTALLIIDMQNDVVHPKGGWAAAGSPVHAKQQNAVAHIKAILERARRRRMPVIHILHAMTPGGRDARANASLFRNLVKSGNNAAGSWGAEPYAGLKPKRGDFVIFKGPLKDNTGKTVIASGTAQQQQDVVLEQMSYLVAGVIGKV